MTSFKLSQIFTENLNFQSVFFLQIGQEVITGDLEMSFSSQCSQPWLFLSHNLRLTCTSYTKSKPPGLLVADIVTSREPSMQSCSERLFCSEDITLDSRVISFSCWFVTRDNMLQFQEWITGTRGKSNSFLLNSVQSCFVFRIAFWSQLGTGLNKLYNSFQICYQLSEQSEVISRHLIWFT